MSVLSTPHPQTIREVVLGDKDLGIEELVAVARHSAKVSFSDAFKARVRKSRRLCIHIGIAITGAIVQLEAHGIARSVEAGGEQSVEIVFHAGRDSNCVLCRAAAKQRLPITPGPV